MTISAPGETCTASPEELERFAALAAEAPSSLGAMFLDRVRASGARESYRRPVGDGWASETWAQTGETVTELAAGLLELGLRPEDRVAVASSTRVEWIHADLAIMCAGGATTTVYPTSRPADVEHVITDSGARFAFAEDAAQLAKLRGLPLERVVLIDGDIDGEAPAGGDHAVLTWAGLRALGRARLAREPGAVTDATAAVKPDQLATLIYTSGTTGRPKGVELTHRSWVYEGMVNQAIRLAEADDLAYLWLPMSHSFGKVLLAAQLAVGHAAAVDGDATRIITNLPVVRPTTMASAPRVYEKVHAGVEARVRAEGGARYRIYAWSVGVGRSVSRLQQRGEKPGALLALQHALADRLVLSTVRERFGGRLRFMISGAAPLSRDVSEWFHAVGLLVLEGYGLTETSAGTSVNRLGRFEFGTVGPPMPGTEVKLDADGEILLRGPGVMQGYHGLPAATAEVLDGEWFRTGDIGEITPGGALRITDRKKDLIKTSGGKYVAPQTIETAFTALCPLAARIVVHGDGRNYITALIALDPDALAVWAAANGRTGAPFAELARAPEVRAAVQAAVEELNAGLSRWETIKKFEILDRELTVEEGDLTPSMKLRRKHVERQYAEVLEAFYRQAGA